MKTLSYWGAANMRGTWIEIYELEQKRKQLTKLAQKLGTSHPAVQKLNKEVEQLALKLQRERVG